MLDYACTQKDQRFAQYLLDKGASIDAHLPSLNNMNFYEVDFSSHEKDVKKSSQSRAATVAASKSSKNSNQVTPQVLENDSQLLASINGTTYQGINYCINLGFCTLGRYMDNPEANLEILKQIANKTDTYNLFLAIASFLLLSLSGVKIIPVPHKKQLGLKVGNTKEKAVEFLEHGPMDISPYICFLMVVSNQRKFNILTETLNILNERIKDAPSILLQSFFDRFANEQAGVCIEADNILHQLIIKQAELLLLGYLESSLENHYAILENQAITKSLLANQSLNSSGLGAFNDNSRALRISSCELLISIVLQYSVFKDELGKRVVILDSDKPQVSEKATAKPTM